MSSKILPTILVVEDDDAFRRVLVSALEARGYDVLGVADAAQRDRRGAAR